MMGTTSSITVQSLGNIAQCAPAVGAKMWCFNVFVFVFTGTAGIKFTHRSKIRFFAPQGRLVAPIQVKLVLFLPAAAAFSCRKAATCRYCFYSVAIKINVLPPSGETMD